MSETEIVKLDNMSLLSKAEIDTAITTAKAFPRDLKRCIEETIQLATFNQQVAESCIYAVPRAGKMMTGESIRLAEIMMYCWTNLDTSTRLVKNDGRFIAVEGRVVDRERNLTYSETIERSIMTSGKNGKEPKQFSYDMQQTTAAAAASIALRKAMFRMVKPFLSVIFDAVKRAAVGDIKSIHKKTEEVVKRLVKMGIQQEKIFDFLEVKRIEEISVEQLQDLIGIGTALKEGSINIEQAFDKTFIGEVAETIQTKADEANKLLDLPTEYGTNIDN